MKTVDVLVLTAIPEEFEAAREVAASDSSGGDGVARWERRELNGTLPYLWGEYSVDGKPLFTVALARPPRMGGRAMGPFATSLVEGLEPATVAMCGVCAGEPTWTALGDVVVGTPVYEWDEGRHSESGFQGAHQQYDLNLRWLRTAQDFDPDGLASYGEVSVDEAALWLLEQLFRGQEPRDHPSRRRYFPNGTWVPRLTELEDRGLIRRQPTGQAILTDDGSNFVQRRLYDDVDGPQRLPFRVLVAPMASGSAVMTDPGVWARLQGMGVRGIAAVDMESATVATVAEYRELPWIVVKGVMDHADPRKDDRYKPFGARASAEVLFALLERLVAETDPVGQRHIGMVGEKASQRPEEAAVKPPPVETAAPSAGQVSAEQHNATRSARAYLRGSGFSREGLIEQLIHDGYSRDVAASAVDSLGIDYNEQAAKTAESYLRHTGFSREGLIGQLSHDGYPRDVAASAVDSLGIDYNQQAAKTAESRLRHSGFSRTGLIHQLNSEGFTPSEAEHGVDQAGL